jgi:hypothetical protein
MARIGAPIAAVLHVETSRSTRTPTSQRVRSRALTNA